MAQQAHRGKKVKQTPHLVQITGNKDGAAEENL